MGFLSKHSFISSHPQLTIKGEMQEWFNWLAWKASIPHKGIGGSNPPLSAKEEKAGQSPVFCFSSEDRKPAFEAERRKTKKLMHSIRLFFALKHPPQGSPNEVR